MGNWKILVQEVEDLDSFNKGTEAEKNFEVRKYVLPKFEFNIYHKPFRRLNDDELNVTACARYSFGKGVNAKFKLEVFAYSISDRPSANQLIILNNRTIITKEV
jgi:hypothetical protein